MDFSLETIMRWLETLSPASLYTSFRDEWFSNRERVEIQGHRIVGVPNDRDCLSPHVVLLAIIFIDTIFLTSGSLHNIAYIDSSMQLRLFPFLQTKEGSGEVMLFICIHTTIESPMWKSWCPRGESNSCCLLCYLDWTQNTVKRKRQER